MPRFILPLLLAFAGLILLGQGAYIHRRRDRRRQKRRQEVPLRADATSVVRFDASGIDRLLTDMNWCCRPVGRSTR